MFPLKDTQPSYSRPAVTITLIAINILIFLFEFALPEQSRYYYMPGVLTRDMLIRMYGLVPDHFRIATLLTSMFLHGSWMHVLGNMLYLWAFGNRLEDALGHAKFLLFYLLCGCAAGMAQVLSNPYSTLPMVGASGAIAGVMGAYLLKFPRARILTLVFIFFFITTFEIPAVILLGYWFIIQLFSGLGSIARTHLSEGGVAWFAHVGGFLTGMLLIKIMGTKDRYSRRRDYYYY
jgi:membrane associated rhomboid family serine protease